MEQLLRSEAKDLVHRYVDRGVLRKEQAWDLLHSKDAADLVSALQAFVLITEDVELRLWKHVIYTVWQGVRSDDEAVTVFSSCESIFFRELLKNKGVLSREFAVKHVFSSADMSDRVTARLASRGIIDVLKLRHFTVIYVLSPDLYQTVMRE